MEFPLDDLDGAIERCEDAKSLIGLMMLRELTLALRLRSPLHRQGRAGGAKYWAWRRLRRR